MQKIKYLIIALLCAVAQGAWADNVTYIERSWSGGNTDGHVVSTEKTATGVTSWDGKTNLTGGWYYFSGSLETNTSRIQVTGNSKLILVDGCHLKHKRGIYIKDGCTLTIYAQSGGTGKLECPSADGDNAAIGGNADAVGGSLVIHGGTIIAKADHNNASGIGGGNHKSGMRSVVIYGGNVTANGKSSGAGIGCGQQNADPPTVTIYGGTVTAKGGDFGAGIGGGEDCGNGTVKIYGGNITATGNMDSAGIGGGECGDQDNPVYIYGGNIYATGASGAAIGGGYKGSGGEVHILGGTVQCVSLGGGRAIGAGEYGSSNGSLELASNLCVKNDKNSGSLVSSSQRISTCQTAYGQCTIQVCSHSGGTSYSQIEGSDGDYYHHVNCTAGYCEGYDEHHIKGDGDACTNCGHKLPEYAYTFYEANAEGTGYAVEGTAYYVTATHEFTFPECSNVPKGKIFAGWEQAAEAPASLAVSNISELEGLKQAGDVITVDMGSNLSYYARYANFYFSGGLGTQASPFQISTTSDWNDLSNAVNGGYNFNGVYLQLTNDISVSTMVGQGDNRFRGKFDGQGYTITVSYTGITEDYCAPFRCISGATIKNLNTTGTIETSSCFAGGVVGYTRYYSTIENCHSNVTIRSSYAGDGGHGGILGLKANVTMSKPTVEGCVFDGKILTTGETATTGCGGIVGWTNEQSLTVKNCLYNPAALGDGETAVACSTIYGEHGGSITCTDCYYTEAYGTAQGTHGYTVTSGTDGLTLDFGDATKTYEYNGIKVYSFEQAGDETAIGLLYNDKLYTSGTTNNDPTIVSFTPEATKQITSLKANGTELPDIVQGKYLLPMFDQNVTITAEFSNETVTLNDAKDNTATITANDNLIVDVTISGRTLYKDGNWNTLCLPFDVTDGDDTDNKTFSGTPLEGATVKELSVDDKWKMENEQWSIDNVNGTHRTGFDGETLYLYFKDATEIVAGKPYLIMWDNDGTTITNLQFNSTEIEDRNPETVTSTDGKVCFKGNYAPETLTAGEGTYYLGKDNKLYWPSTAKQINAFRAYFTVDLSTDYGGEHQGVRAFVLNFGDDDDTTGITTTNYTNFTNSDNAWYDMQGRKVARSASPLGSSKNGQWSMVNGQLKKGLYIYKGKKVVIK